MLAPLPTPRIVGDRLRPSLLMPSRGGMSRISADGDDSRLLRAVATFRRKKPFLDDRATDLGARTRRQIAAGKV